MDEAERCHRLAYISYGNLLAHGTVDEVIEHVAPDDLVGHRPRSAHARASSCATSPACSKRSLSATRCTSAATMPRRWSRRSRRSATRPTNGDRFASGLEDVFIHLMERSTGQLRAMSDAAAISHSRGLRGDHREGIHPDAPRPADVRDDARHPAASSSCSSAYAINSDPRHLPAAVLLADHGPQGRTLLHAMKNSTYFDFVRQVQTEAEGRDLLARGDVQFVINIPQNFTRDLLRGDRPSILVEADATDPAATGIALGSLGSGDQRRPAKRPQRPARLLSTQPPARSTCASTRSTTPRPSPNTTSCPG